MLNIRLIQKLIEIDRFLNLNSTIYVLYDVKSITKQSGIKVKVKVKVKFALEQVMKAQSGGRCVALFFL